MAAPFAIPYTLSQTSSTPDLLNTGRMVLSFGDVPGVADDGMNSVGGVGLSLKAADVTIPGFQIAQIRVPLLGHTRAFRGHFDHQNHFSSVLYEDSKGGTFNTIWNWMDAVRDFDDGTSGDTNDYSIKRVLLTAFTATGQIAYQISFANVWPFNISPAASSDDGASPARHNVDFSMDNPSFVAGNYQRMVKDMSSPGNSIIST